MHEFPIDAKNIRLADFEQDCGRLIVVADTQARITWVNDAFCRTTGYATSEVHGKPLRELFSGQDNDLLTLDDLQAAIEARQSVRGVQLALHKRDGTPCWIELELVPVFDAAGEVAAYVAFHEDIAHRRHQKQKRESDELLLEEAVRIGKFGAWELDFATRRLRWTDQVYAIHDMPADARIDLAMWWGCLPHAARHAMQRAVHDCTAFRTECQITTPTGHARWVRVVGHLKLDAHGRPIRLVGTCEDISEQHDNEVRIADLEERLRVTAAATQTGLWECSLLEASCSWDSQMRRIFGVPEDGPPPGRDEWAALLHPDDAARVLRSLDELQRGAISACELDYRVAVNDGAGSVRHIHSLVRRTNGAVPKLVGTVTDVTNARNADEAIRAKSELLSHVSHELRTPLNGVLGFVQLLEHDGARLQPEHRAIVRNIGRCGAHLLELTRDLLDLAAIEGRAARFSPEVVPVYDVAREVADLMEPMAMSCDIAVTVLAEHDLTVVADRRRLRQVLMNLLSNGIKYTPRGGSVSLSWRTRDGGVELSVADSGYGIAPAKLDQLFEPFNRLGIEANGIEGTGLGLSVTRGLVNAMNGRIGVHSQFGVGTVFDVWLPSPSRPAVDIGDVEEPSSLMCPRNERPAIRVLYVEHDPHNAMRLNQALAHRAKRCQVDVAMDAESAVRRFASQRYDLVLIDLNLPGMNGFDLLRRLQDESGHRAVPCVAVSGDKIGHETWKALSAGFDDCWAKPLDLDALPARIDRTLHPQDRYQAGVC